VRDRNRECVYNFPHILWMKQKSASLNLRLN